MLNRVEADNLVVGYEFDLRSSEIIPRTVPNPSAGTVHSFDAYRLEKDSDKAVSLSAKEPDVAADDEES